MTAHKRNDEAMQPKRAIGAYTGPAGGRNVGPGVQEIRTSEIKNMRGQSSFNISLIHSQYGK